MVKANKRKLAAAGAPVASGQKADLATRPLSSTRRCVECGATSTPQWREGPCGPKTLCNACGVRHLRALKKAAEQTALALREQKRALEADVTPGSVASDQQAARKSRRLSMGTSFAGHTSCSDLTAGLHEAAQTGPVLLEAQAFDGDQVELEVAEELLCLAAGSVSDGASEGMAAVQQVLPEHTQHVMLEPALCTDSNARNVLHRQQHQLRAVAAVRAPTRIKQQHKEVGQQSIMVHLPLLRATTCPPTARRPTTIGTKHTQAAAGGACGGLLSAMQTPTHNMELVLHDQLLPAIAAAATAAPGSPLAAQASADAGGTADGSRCDGETQPTAAAAIAAAAQLSISSLTDQERTHLKMLQQALAEAQAHMQRAELEQQQVFQYLVRMQAEAQLARLRVQQYAQTLKRELMQLSLYCLLHRSQQGAPGSTATTPAEMQTFATVTHHESSTEPVDEALATIAPQVSAGPATVTPGA